MKEPNIGEAKHPREGVSGVFTQADCLHHGVRVPDSTAPPQDTAVRDARGFVSGLWDRMFKGSIIPQAYKCLSFIFLLSRFKE